MTRGDNFEPAVELLELEVEVLAMLFRRLPRGLVARKDVGIQAGVEPQISQAESGGMAGGREDVSKVSPDEAT